MIILPESFIEIAAVAVTQHGGDFFHVLFGAGQLGHLHEETLPGKKALIVTSNGQSAKKYGYLARVEKELDLAGVGHVLFDEIRPNPTRENVMDCAKCIALMAANTGDIWDYSLSGHGGKKTPEFDAIPIVAVTTSAGTGSEVDIRSILFIQSTTLSCWTMGMARNTTLGMPICL